MALQAFLFIFAATSLAANPPVLLEELQKILASYQKVESLQTSFVQKKQLKDLGITLESRGTFTFRPKQGVIWKVTSPAPMEIALSDGKVTLTTGAGKDERTESWALAAAGPDTAKSMAGVVAWLKMDAREIDSAYQVQKEAPNTYRCLPKNPSTNLFRGLWMKLGPSGHLEWLKIEEKSGDEMEFTFMKPQIKYIP